MAVDDASVDEEGVVASEPFLKGRSSSCAPSFLCKAPAPCTEMKPGGALRRAALCWLSPSSPVARWAGRGVRR